MDDHGDMATIELAIAMMADIPDMATIALIIAMMADRLDMAIMDLTIDRRRRKTLRSQVTGCTCTSKFVNFIPICQHVNPKNPEAMAIAINESPIMNDNFLLDTVWIGITMNTIT